MLCLHSIYLHIFIYIYISADPSPFSRGRRKEWRRRRVGLLVVDVLLIPCALSWRRSGVWLCRIHCQEAAALGLFGVGCVTFSVYVGGLCLFSFRGFRLVTSARCGGGFLARFEPGVWLFWVHRREVAALGVPGLGCVPFSVHVLGPLRGRVFG